MTLILGQRRARLMQTGQTTAYHVGDDGDYEAGLEKVYNVLTIGQYSGTVNLDVPHYVANGITFTAAGNIVADAAAGMVTFLAGDIVVISNSANNTGVYTVAVGGVAGQFTTVEAIVNEAAGAYIRFHKRTAHSNNCVWDRRTGRMWSRYTSDAELVGEASDGKLVWYDVARIYALHPAAADLQMIAATDTLRIVGGAGEVARYAIGDILDCTGFANAVNNLPGYYVLSVTINGADLDIVLDPVNNTLIDEAAAGARSINLVCRSIFGYVAAARASSLGGYTDWRAPCNLEGVSIPNYEQNQGLPAPAVFPGWPADGVWMSTSQPNTLASAFYVNYGDGILHRNVKTGNFFFASLIRG